MDELKKDIYRIKRKIEILRMQKENQIRKLHCANWQWCRGRTKAMIKEIEKQINDLYDQL